MTLIPIFRDILASRRLFANGDSLSGARAAGATAIPDAIPDHSGTTLP